MRAHSRLAGAWKVSGGTGCHTLHLTTTDGQPAWATGRGMASALLLGSVVLLVAAASLLLGRGDLDGWQELIVLVLALSAGGMLKRLREWSEPDAKSTIDTRCSRDARSCR